jgi:hypothetical protein
MSKLFSTEAAVRHAEALTALVGPDALRLQRNIIAQRRCGLPRP